MKRAGNLVDRIADADNLRLAFWKASKSRTSSPTRFTTVTPAASAGVWTRRLPARFNSPDPATGT